MHKELCNRVKNHIFPTIPKFNLKRLLDEVLHDSEEVDSFNELFFLALKRKPILLLTLICPYIDISTLRIPLSIESPDYDDFPSKYTLVFTSDIDEYSKILDVKLNDYGVPIEEENPAESYLESHISAGENIEINLLGFNGFNCSVTFTGYITGGLRTLYYVETLHPEINLTVSGLKQNKNVPNWVEFLVDSLLNLEYGNNRMAFFNIFDALENLITIIHDEISFEYFIEQKPPVKKISDCLL